MRRVPISMSPIQPHMQLRLTLLFTIGAAFLSVAAETEKPPTLDELVAKNIEAKGGADALKALQSLKLTGKMLAVSRTQRPREDVGGRYQTADRRR